MADSSHDIGAKKKGKKKKKKLNPMEAPQDEPATGRSGNAESELTKAQQRLNALRLQRALPPLIHGGVSQIAEKKGTNEYLKSENSDLDL